MSFYSIEIVKSIPVTKLKKTLSNIFDYKKAPSDDLTKFETTEEYYETFKKCDRDFAKKVIDPNIDCVYAKISYPLKNPAIIKIKITDTDVPVTYGMLLYAYTLAYQHIYKIEDEDVGAPTGNIPGMLNRLDSSGRFGIWGHHIGDLCYNGLSKINIYDKFVVCEFSCDS